jgi:hypothetical protein
MVNIVLKENIKLPAKSWDFSYKIRKTCVHSCFDNHNTPEKITCIISLSANWTVQKWKNTKERTSRQGKTATWHRDISLKTKVISAMDVCLQSNNNYYNTHYTMLFNLSNHFQIYILTLPLHICDINSHYCIFLCWIHLRMAETCTKITTFVHCL